MLCTIAVVYFMVLSCMHGVIKYIDKNILKINILYVNKEEKIKSGRKNNVTIYDTINEQI